MAETHKQIVSTLVTRASKLESDCETASTENVAVCLTANKTRNNVYSILLTKVNKVKVFLKLHITKLCYI